MTNGLPPKKLRVCSKKIDFWTLCKKFKFEVVRHFLITVVWTVFLSFVLAMISNLSEKKPTNGNFSSILPEKLRGFFPNLTLKQLAVWGLVLIGLFAFISYFSSLWEEELRIKGGHYTKNVLLDKFRQLSLEEKQKRQKEINTLVELDSGEIGHYWEHIPNHVFHSTLTIVFLIWMKWGDFSQMRAKEAFFSFGWLLLVNIFSFFFTKLILKNDKRYKKELAKEWADQQKETRQAVLIDSMGLTSQYRSKQRKISKKNENLLFSFGPAKSLNKTIPHHWLIEMFPYLLLLISGVFEIAQKNLLGMWFIYDNFKDIFQCFWDYSDYATSQERVNNFLSLPEKNDNLEGIKLTKLTKIKALHFQNITFSYSGQSQPILKNYNRTFFKGEANYLTGANGTGKSTILYLLLGMLVPQQGRVIVETESGITYNLHQDLNLQTWREYNIAYCAHENLIESGSTGQKQWTNIQNTLNTKSKAHIFLFDEADNALDSEKQEKFQREIKKLINKNKIVIYIRHKTLEK
jgi:ABC-type bacteriocin/lantibiotic exporter with double-glycine peptidase domain